MAPTKAAAAIDSLAASSGGGGGGGGVSGGAPTTMTVVEFERIWWDYNSGAHSHLSVWRPVCPQAGPSARIP